MICVELPPVLEVGGIKKPESIGGVVTPAGAHVASRRETEGECYLTRDNPLVAERY